MREREIKKEKRKKKRKKKIYSLLRYGMSIIIDGDDRSVLAGGDSPMTQCQVETRSSSTFLASESVICKNGVLGNILSAEGKMKEKQS